MQKKKKRSFFKKISIRYLKSSIYNILAKSKFIANKFYLYNKSISFHDVNGIEKAMIKSDNDLVFIAKELQDVIFQGNTGNTIYRNKSITNYNGYLTQNYIKPIFRSKIVEENTLSINLIGIRKGHKHFFHFFFDYIMPLLIYIKMSNIKENLSIFVRSDNSTVQLETFKALENNFSNIKFIRIKENQIVQCKKAFYLYHNHHALYYKNENQEIKEIFNDLRLILIKYYNIKNLPYAENYKLYISRSKTRLRRTLNEKKLIPLLKERGFKVVNLEDFNLKEQINFFNNAKIIIGAHGAGFTNLIFCNSLKTKATKIIEIFPKNLHKTIGNITDFRDISKIKDIKRYEFTTNNQLIWQCFFIDVKKIIKLIDAIDND